MANTNLIVTFLDALTQLPLASGLTVTIYPQGAAQIPGNVVATGTLGANGAAALALQFNTNYTAVFSGSGAPSYPYSFSLGSGQFVVGPFATVSDQQNSANGFLGIQTVNASGSPVKTLFQWGFISVVVGADGTATQAVTFPEQFPNGLFFCDPVVYDGASDNGYFSKAKSIAESQSGFTCVVESAPPNTNITVRFFALGY